MRLWARCHETNALQLVLLRRVLRGGDALVESRHRHTMDTHSCLTVVARGHFRAKELEVKPLALGQRQLATHLHGGRVTSCDVM